MCRPSCPSSVSHYPPKEIETGIQSSCAIIGDKPLKSLKKFNSNRSRRRKCLLLIQLDRRRQAAVAVVVNNWERDLKLPVNFFFNNNNNNNKWINRLTGPGLLAITIAAAVKRIRNGIQTGIPSFRLRSVGCAIYFLKFYFISGCPPSYRIRNNNLFTSHFLKKKKEIVTLKLIYWNS